MWVRSPDFGDPCCLLAQARVYPRESGGGGDVIPAKAGYVFSQRENHPQSAPALPQGMAGAIVFDKKTRGRIEAATR
ncbi:MAG: hypothetical protein MUO33_04440 [Sedimentisphaerales bacterium]|nr:hypothetical protein [Sedimentisphaerales bacterium]